MGQPGGYEQPAAGIPAARWLATPPAVPAGLSAAAGNRRGALSWSWTAGAEEAGGEDGASGGRTLRGRWYMKSEVQSPKQLRMAARKRKMTKGTRARGPAHSVQLPSGRAFPSPKQPE